MGPLLQQEANFSEAHTALSKALWLRFEQYFQRLWLTRLNSLPQPMSCSSCF